MHPVVWAVILFWAPVHAALWDSREETRHIKDSWGDDIDLIDCRTGPSTNITMALISTSFIVLGEPLNMFMCIFDKSLIRLDYKVTNICWIFFCFYSLKLACLLKIIV